MKDVGRFVGLATLAADLYRVGLVVNVLAGDALTELIQLKRHL